jgi:hypothetical protein
MIPGYSMPIQESFIESLLKAPLATNDIVSKIYNTLLESFRWMLSKGIEFEITSPSFDAPKRSANMSEQDLYAIFTSGSYVLNSLFVKHFFTTFGDFLKLIEPFYEEPFGFRDFHNFIAASTGDGDGYFVPASHYSLTPVAIALFGLDSDPEKSNVITTNIPLQALFDAIPPAFGKARQTPSALIAKYAKPSDKRALRVKITLTRDEDIWKLIELTDRYTLEQLHYLICDEFFLEPTENYFFNTDINMNVFTMYTPSSHKLKHKKTDQTMLKHLPLEEKSCFYYCLERSMSPYLLRGNSFEVNSELYEIEVVKIKNPTGIEMYPRVVRESNSLKDLFSFFDTDLGF